MTRAVEIPVIGMGGVQSGHHAYELLRAGATLVAVGTESFRDPAAGARIAAELEELHGRRTDSDAVARDEAQISGLSQR